jgi:hypothetical protein
LALDRAPRDQHAHERHRASRLPLRGRRWWLRAPPAMCTHFAGCSGGGIWMASYDGKSDTCITSSPEGEAPPCWNPDGQSLAFPSSRPGRAQGNQVWILDRRGGEAQQLTGVKGHSPRLRAVTRFETPRFGDWRSRSRGSRGRRGCCRRRPRRSRAPFCMPIGLRRQ